MLTITAHSMYNLATDHHVATAEEVGVEVEARIRKAAEAGLTTTTVTLLHNGSPMEHKARATLIGWLREAGFNIYADPDNPPSEIQVSWGAPANDQALN